MARASRKTHRKHKTHRRHSRRNTRRGGAMLQGAPLSYSLSDDWSSKMSQGQGGDYLKYHVGQHGGAYLSGAPLSEISGSALPGDLRGPAHIGGIDKAVADVAHLKDQAGGRRKKSKKNGGRRKSSKKNGGRRKSHGARKSRSRRSKKRGGALGYAPFGGSSMLLNSTGYQQAGLNPEYVTGGVERQMAQVREAM